MTKPESFKVTAQEGVELARIHLQMGDKKVATALLRGAVETGSPKEVRDAKAMLVTLRPGPFRRTWFMPYRCPGCGNAHRHALADFGLVRAFFQCKRCDAIATLGLEYPVFIAVIIAAGLGMADLVRPQLPPLDRWEGWAIRAMLTGGMMVAFFALRHFVAGHWFRYRPAAAKPDH